MSFHEIVTSIESGPGQSYESVKTRMENDKLWE